MAIVHRYRYHSNFRYRHYTYGRAYERVGGHRASFLLNRDERVEVVRLVWIAVPPGSTPHGMMVSPFMTARHTIIYRRRTHATVMLQQTGHAHVLYAHRG